MPDAPPGTLLAIGDGYRWIAYEIDGTTHAALYVKGKLLRRDWVGWWVATFSGTRQPVQGDPVRYFQGTGPTDQFPPHPEQGDLA